MRVLVVLPLVLMTACTHLPSTVDGVRSQSIGVANYCSNMSMEDTYALVTQQVARCFVRETRAGLPNTSGVTSGSGITSLFITSAADDIENGVRSDGSAWVALKRAINGRPLGYLLLVELKGTQRCPTLVDVYVTKREWLERAQVLRAWIEDLEPKC